MSDNISICISVDIHVGLVGRKVDISQTIDNIKRFAREYDPEKFKDIIDGYDCTVTAASTGAPADESEYCVGDEVYFIGNGCAVKDRITSVLVETENGYHIDIDDIFHSMEELVERLKQDVHG